MAVLGPRFCARAFSSCGKWGPLFIAVCGPLTIVASLVVEHRLQTRRLSNCGSWAQLLRGMWDLPRPGPEPVSPALAGRFSTTAPPGKPLKLGSLLQSFYICKNWGIGKAAHLMPNNQNWKADLPDSKSKSVSGKHILYGRQRVKTLNWGRAKE